MAESPNPGVAAPEGLLELPTPVSVFRRAAILLALWYRSDSEREGVGADQLWGKLASVAALADLEPWERRVLLAPVGSLSARDVAASSWRLEGAAVLAWALRGSDLLAPDALASVDRVATALGWDSDLSASVRAAHQLRPVTTLEWYATRARALQWRLREFRLRRALLDFRSVAVRLGLGNPDELSIPLIDGDLAVDGGTLAAADPDRVRILLAAAVERHNAAAWLLRSGVLYSETAINT